MDELYTVIETNCPMCGETHLITVPIEGYARWQNGACIQDAMPELSADDREMLISGICPRCWDDMFGR